MTPACDVYSLALTLYEAWTGTNPVRAGGPAATARRLGRPLPSLAALRRDLPLELCDAVDEALEIDPAHRPAPARAARRAARRRSPSLTDEGGLVEPATLQAGRASRACRAAARSRGAGRAPGLLEPSGGTARGRPPACPAARARRRGSGRRRPRARGARGPRSRSVLLAARRRRHRRRRDRRAAAHRLAARGDRRCAPGSSRPRPTARAPRCCLPPRPPRSRCCSRARDCSGRCPCWRRCWARSRSRRPSSESRRSPPRPHAAPAWLRPASGGSCSARRSRARRCCSALPTERCRAATGRARYPPRPPTRCSRSPPRRRSHPCWPGWPWR